jgi:tRNA 2-selenouridine synthase
MIKTTNIKSFLDEVKQELPVFDVRSPKEFLAGHIPGAINLPLLNDDERHEVGITYKKEGHEAAVRLGYRLVGHKFIDYIEAARAMAKDNTVCLYCWRGGMRSNTMAWLLTSVGLKVYLLEGGYKQFRNWCLHQFEHKWPLMVISGKTGAGKTEVLHELRKKSESVIDLEALAHHRGSAFGALGLPLQPTQESFENNLAWSLSFCQTAKRVWIENESRFIGKVRIPDAFFAQSSSADLISIDRDLNSRALRIIHEYGKFDKEVLIEKTKSITKRMGGDRVKASVEALESGDYMGWVLPLLDYYDRSYEHSIRERTGKYERLLNVQSQLPHQIATQLLLLNPQ